MLSFHSALLLLPSSYFPTKGKKNSRLHIGTCCRVGGRGGSTLMFSYWNSFEFQKEKTVRKYSMELCVFVAYLALLLLLLSSHEWTKGKKNLLKHMTRPPPPPPPLLLFPPPLPFPSVGPAVVPWKFTIGERFINLEATPKETKFLEQLTFPQTLQQLYSSFYIKMGIPHLKTDTTTSIPSPALRRLPTFYFFAKSPTQ